MRSAEAGCVVIDIQSEILHILNGDFPCCENTYLVSLIFARDSSPRGFVL